MPAIALEAFGGLIGRWIWLSLIHSLWIGLLAAAAAALITQSAPRVFAPGPPRDPGRRDVRHGPGACRDDRLAPPRARGRTVRPRGGSAASSSFGLAGHRSQGRAGRTPPQAMTGRPSRRRPLHSPSPAGRRPGSLGRSRATRPTLLVLWSLTVVVLVATLTFGMLGLGRLRRGAEPAGEQIQRQARRLADS